MSALMDSDTPRQGRRAARQLQTTMAAARVNDASRAAAQQPTKYVVNRVQLRGQNGTIVATDSKQLFVSGGFAFPFKEDLLIPRSGVFGLLPFQSSEKVGIGRTDTHFVIRIGSWTFAFWLDKEGRFPDAASIIPRPSHAKTRFHLDPDDAERLLNSLTRKIKNSTGDQTVTIDLTEHPCFRYAIEDRVMEVSLAKSTVEGKPLRICVYLQSLLRLLELRFADFEFIDPSKPLVARDGDRLYMVMPLTGDLALKPRPDAIPVPVVEKPTSAMVPVNRPVAKSPIIIPTGPTAVAESVAGFDLLGEAEGLRVGLIKVADHRAGS